MKVKSESEVALSCPTLSDPMAGEVVKNKKQKLLHESFQDLVFLGHYKVTMGHHLLLRSPKESLKHWALLIFIVPGGFSLQEE